MQLEEIELTNTAICLLILRQLEKLIEIFSSCIMYYKIIANVRVYDPLRDQGALLSSYRKITKSDNPRNPIPAMAYTRC
jgi:hypothetical protein